MSTGKLSPSDSSVNALLPRKCQIENQPGQACTGLSNQKAYPGGATRMAELAVTVEHCRAELLHVAAQVLGSSDDADDIVQDALLEALVSLSEDITKPQTEAWLCGIVLNTALRANRIRAQELLESIETLSLREKNQHCLALVDRGMDAERHYELQRMLESLATILEGMSDARQRIFQMCVLEECRVPQVAALLNLSPANVKALTFRTKRALRREISKLSDRRRKNAFMNAESAQTRFSAEHSPQGRPRKPQIWSMGVIEDRLARGRRFRVLILIDRQTRECLMLHAGTALSGEKVAKALEEVIALHGAPKSITVDDGTELASKAMIYWSYLNRMHPEFDRRESPVENGYIESFNGRLREECLNEEVFFSVREIRRKLELWRQNYNKHLLHSALCREP